MAAPKFYEFNANADDFQIYIERMEQHFEANKISEENIKVAVLLSSIGPETYKLVRDLTFPELPKTKTFSNLCKLLGKQYSVQVSVWRERKKFYELSQGDLTISDWYAKIRSSSTKCNFGNDLSKVLRDRFVTGLSTPKIFDRICEESEEKSLDELVSLAQKCENNGQYSVRYVSNFPPNDGRSLQRKYGKIDEQRQLVWKKRQPEKKYQ
ncbi:hypothetical protein NQ314_007782 [Rhamnusium bicolor]|uniref:Uncharacterized protein n=1 Tax=Rhamnusium bicolor TaxID=1586634 RepID=A0AAV8YJU5_9CUCU|nr:hypothetical protein NQ314_007782 [Rhamnusium bicolor]